VLPFVVSIAHKYMTLAACFSFLEVPLCLAYLARATKRTLYVFVGRMYPTANKMLDEPLENPIGVYKPLLKSSFQCPICRTIYPYQLC
jgi:hypothetical protein